MRGSASWRALGALSAIAAATTPALAHTTERAFILLLPTGYYLLGGALAVVASFVILLALPEDRLRHWSDARWVLGRHRVRHETIVSLFSFAALVTLILAGYFGSRDPLENPLPLTVWTIWWIGLTIAHALFGNLWRFLNPWVGPFRLLGLRKVMLEDLLQGLALEWHQALVELAALHVLQRDREPAVAQEAAFGAFEFLLLLVAGHASNPQLGGAVGHQQLDRPGALDLEGHPARALLVRPQEDVERGGMTEQSCDIFGVVPAVQHPLPGPCQADQAPSNVQILEKESLNVVRLHEPKYRCRP